MWLTRTVLLILYNMYISLHVQLEFSIARAAEVKDQAIPCCIIRPDMGSL